MTLSMDASKAFLHDDSIQRLPDINLKISHLYNNPRDDYLETETPILKSVKSRLQGKSY